MVTMVTMVTMAINKLLPAYLYKAWNRNTPPSAKEGKIVIVRGRYSKESGPYSQVSIKQRD